MLYMRYPLLSQNYYDCNEPGDKCFGISNIKFKQTFICVFLKSGLVSTKDLEYKKEQLNEEIRNPEFYEHIMLPYNMTLCKFCIQYLENFNEYTLFQDTEFILIMVSELPSEFWDKIQIDEKQNLMNTLINILYEFQKKIFYDKTSDIILISLILKTFTEVYFVTNSIPEQICNKTFFDYLMDQFLTNDNLIHHVFYTFLVMLINEFFFTGSMDFMDGAFSQIQPVFLFNTIYYFLGISIDGNYYACNIIALMINISFNTTEENATIFQSDYVYHTLVDLCNYDINAFMEEEILFYMWNIIIENNEIRKPSNRF